MFIGLRAYRAIGLGAYRALGGSMFWLWGFGLGDVGVSGWVTTSPHAPRV